MVNSDRIEERSPFYEVARQAQSDKLMISLACYSLSLVMILLAIVRSSWFSLGGAFFSALVGIFYYSSPKFRVWWQGCGYSSSNEIEPVDLFWAEVELICDGVVEKVSASHDCLVVDQCVDEESVLFSDGHMSYAVVCLLFSSLPESDGEAGRGLGLACFHDDSWVPTSAFSTSPQTSPLEFLEALRVGGLLETI